MPEQAFKLFPVLGLRIGKNLLQPVIQRASAQEQPVLDRIIALPVQNALNDFQIQRVALCQAVFYMHHICDHRLGIKGAALMRRIQQNGVFRIHFVHLIGRGFPHDQAAGRRNVNLMVFHLVILQKLPCVVGTLPHIHEIDGHGRDAGLAVSAQRPVGKRGNIQIFRNPQPVLLTVADEAEGDIVVGADHGVKILPFLPEGFKALIHTLTVEKDRVIRIGAPSGVQIALEDFTAHQIVDTALAAGHQRNPFLFAGNWKG